MWRLCFLFFFFFNDPAPTEIYPLSYPPLFRSRIPATRPSSMSLGATRSTPARACATATLPSRYTDASFSRSEEHTSELQSLAYLVCRLLLEKKKNSETVLAMPPSCTRHVLLSC